MILSIKYFSLQIPQLLQSLFITSISVSLTLGYDLSTNIVNLSQIIHFARVVGSKNILQFSHHPFSSTYRCLGYGINYVLNCSRPKLRANRYTICERFIMLLFDIHSMCVFCPILCDVLVSNSVSIFKKFSQKVSAFSSKYKSCYIKYIVFIDFKRLFY